MVAFWGIYATYDVYNRSKPNKELQISVDAIIPLVDISPEAVDDITILYKGQPVKNVMLVQVKITNTGNQPITESDYVDPVSFTIASPSEIIDVSIINSVPSNIGLTINKISQYQADVTPVLLNPDDIVTARFAVLADNSDSILNDLHIDGRIVGLKSIDFILPSNKKPDSKDILINALVAFAGNILIFA